MWLGVVGRHSPHAAAHCSTQCYTHTVLTYAGGSSLLPSVFIKLRICSSTHGVINGGEGRGAKGRGGEGKRRGGEREGEKRGKGAEKGEERGGEGSRR